MTAATATRPPTVEERERFAMLREAFLHTAAARVGPDALDYLGEWWRRLSIDDRRLVLAFAGLDDDEAAAARPWPQMLMEHRATLLRECKRLRRLLDPLRFV